MGLIALQTLGILVTGFTVLIWFDWQWGLVITVSSKLYFMYAAACYDPNKPPKEEEPRYISPSEFYAQEHAKKMKARKKSLAYRQSTRPVSKLRATCPNCKTHHTVAVASAVGVVSACSDSEDLTASIMDGDNWLTTTALIQYETSEISRMDINPANGLPCFDGIDVEGNLYGTDSHAMDDCFTSIDDSFMSMDESFSSIDDDFSSAFDDY